MVYILIVLFFVTLLLFFFSSGVWHWVWFGRGVDRSGLMLIRRFAYFKRQGEAAVPAAHRFAAVVTTLMVLGSISGLAVVTYLLIR